VPHAPVNESPEWARALDADQEAIEKAYARLIERAKTNEEKRLVNAGLAALMLSRLDENTRVGTFSRLARLHAGFTQAELGERLGCSRILVARIESGRKPMRHDRWAEAWAEACNVPLGIVLLDSIPR
jgi:ribosome-binding protein aMBF1 (putative translation factor)